MINSELSAIASARGVVTAAYVSPITLLLCIIGVPGVVALAVVSYVYSKEAKQEEAQEEEQADAEHAALTRNMSTRRWFAERYVPCALDRAVLHSIPLRTFTSATAEQMMSSCCVVCLGPFQVGESLKVLPPCQHTFHMACIDKWFDSNSTCPICRCQVGTPYENAVQPHVTTLDIVVN